MHLPIIDVASAIGVYYKDIKEMNLHLTGEVIPSGVQALSLPPGSSEQFWTFFKDWKKTCLLKRMAGDKNPTRNGIDVTKACTPCGPLPMRFLRVSMTKGQTRQFKGRPLIDHGTLEREVFVHRSSIQP